MFWRSFRPLNCISTILWIYFVSIHGVNSDCLSLIKADENSLTVPAGTQCDLAADVNVNLLTVSGTVRVTSPRLVVVTAANIVVTEGGSIIADGLTTGGVGVGNNKGSGG